MIKTLPAMREIGVVNSNIWDDDYDQIPREVEIHRKSPSKLSVVGRLYIEMEMLTVCRRRCDSFDGQFRLLRGKHAFQVPQRQIEINPGRLGVIFGDI
ncbi:hypothetical protein V1639_00765 [Pseudarthrobacter sp. J75]|nr:MULTISPECIES: hypothetical protein [unclassified Pseudarthrobacter]MEE2527560.1 hypothetical protein [Pseudarthrobacter sp. J75]MEE2569742.1 hypothetical protein [Pseudarthrobacter sp. J64]